MNDDKIGQSDADKKLDAIRVCREVVAEIMNLNPSQEQILMIVQFLALELHNHEQMVELVAATKEYMAEKNPLILPAQES
jgi:hypothetical protein